MKTERLLRGGFHALGIFACVGTLLPFSRANVWWVRIFDFPRVQVAAMGAIAAVLGLLRRKRGGGWDRGLLGAVAVAEAVQAFEIGRYTRLAPRQSVVAHNAKPQGTLRLLAANVQMSNRRADLLLQLVRKRQPEIVLLLETDGWWAEQMKALQPTYPYSVRQPQDNTYGMLLYSRLTLVNPELRFLVQARVPSIRTSVRLPNGEIFTLYAVHPKPPGRPNREGEIRGSGPRDAELVMVAREIEHRSQPVIVAGDFNDVAWSHTTRLFQRIGRVLDPRIGRGFYNTFHAEHPLLRFPVDHLFHSEEFVLVNFDREGYIGSDHFPICATLSLASGAKAAQKPPQPEKGDQCEAEKAVKNGGARQP